MPHIVVYCPPLDKDKKVDVVKSMTDAFAKSTGHDPEIISVHIQEFSYHNIGVGGKLLSDVLPKEHVTSSEELLKFNKFEEEG